MTQRTDYLVPPLDVSAIQPKGFDFAVTFDQELRDRICDELDVVSIEEVTAKGHAWPVGKGIELQFLLHARLTQTCVVTLEPMGSHVDEQVSLQYMPETSAPAVTEIVEIDGEDDPPEPLIGDLIDIGSAVLEHLALSIDPWPRRPDAELPGEGGDDAEDARRNPFAVLAKLKTNTDD